MARVRGEGAISQKHGAKWGCPPATKVLTCRHDGEHPDDACPEPKTTYHRPKHRCKGPWMGQHGRRAGRVTVYGKTRKEVADELDKVKRRRPSTGAATNWTLEKWMHYYLYEVQPGRTKPSTRRGERSKNKTYIVPLIGHYKLGKLERQPQVITSMYNRIRKPCPEPKSVCRHKPKHKVCDEPTMVCPHEPTHGRKESTIRQTHAILHRALKVAVKEGHIDRNPAALAEKPKTESEHRKPLTLQGARKVLTASHGTLIELRVYLRLLYGLRQGEILGLSWPFVLFEGLRFGIFKTRQDDDDLRPFLGTPKSKKSRRWLPMIKVIESRFRVAWAQHILEHPECRDGCVGTEENPHLVFTGPTGSFVDPKKDWEAWRDLLVEAGVPHAAPHAARNTSATLLRAAGAPQSIVTEILGHSTMLLTADVYTGEDIELQRTVLEDYSAYLDGPEGLPLGTEDPSG